MRAAYPAARFQPVTQPVFSAPNLLTGEREALLSSPTQNGHHVRVIGESGVVDVAEASAAGEPAVLFRVADPGHQLTGVRLSQDVRIAGDRLGFHRSGDGWELLIARPLVNRMEYLLELAYPDGGTATVLDPPYLTRLIGQVSE
jgi:hypothetical protein